jgi:type IV secretory pathway VirD2 relaxase
MSEDDSFEPRLGRIRSKGGRTAKRFLHQVLAATALAGGLKRLGGARFTGARIGRGASIGRVLGSRDRLGGLRGRRGIVKARFVRLAGKGLANAHAHLRYLERDGTTREGAPGQLYGPADDPAFDDADGKAFIERGAGDRHQFRFIVSAEDGDQYEDLKPLTRRLMAQMEKDLGTKLDWVAVDHFNTGHPHSHIILRGVDDTGQNLVIARDYIAHGIRARLVELLDGDLGPRSTLEIESRLRHDVQAERVTAIDRQLLRSADKDRIVTPHARDPMLQSLRAGRLQKLQRLGLAEDIGKGRWRLDADMELTLKAMGERGDIIVALHHDLKAHGIDRALADQSIHDRANTLSTPIVGRVITRGLSDELQDRHYLIVDGVDGRVHYLDIGKGDAVEPLPKDSIISVSPRSGGVRQSDRTIIEVAAANGGTYDVEAHLAYDSSASEDFATSHVRRLEAMRRVMSKVERNADGSWTIAPDHLDRVAAYEARLARDRPVAVAILSSQSLEHQAGFDGATWLDTELASGSPIHARDTGFGREVKTALGQRQSWLLNQGLAEQKSSEIFYPPGMITNLERRELLRVAGQFSRELGLSFAEAEKGGRIEGILRRSVDLASGRFALIQKSREFNLVPWRPVLEKQIGKQVTGVMRGEGISWAIGRGRNGPEIS